MARDVADTNYYIMSCGKIPVKWTAPEVRETLLINFIFIVTVHNVGLVYETILHS